MIEVIMYVVIISVIMLLIISITKKLTKPIFTVFLVGYVMILIYILYFPRQFANKDIGDIIVNSIQLSPLSSIANSIEMANISNDYRLLIWNWIGNLFLLMPIAVSIGYYKQKLKLFPTIFYGFLISALIELSQLLMNIYFYHTNNKVIDIDDVIINGIGFMICYSAVYALSKRRDVKE